MTYETPRALRTALEHRLLATSTASGIGLDRLRRRVLFERIVARLEAAEPGCWVLKGGMALEVRLRDDARLTKDIDLGLRDEVRSPVDLHERIVGALSSDPDHDGFKLRAGVSTQLREDGSGQLTWRVRVAAILADKRSAASGYDPAAAGILAGPLRTTRGRQRRRRPALLSRGGDGDPTVGRDVPDQGDVIVMARSKRPVSPVSPQAKLAAVIKSARDTMRKDAGLNGDLDRIPQLAWLLFLRAFDGLEQNREITEEKFRLSIESPYRWRDWAADPDGATGEVLLRFVNEELLPHLRELTGTGGHDPRDVLAAVFKETNNRMLSGYLLRDVVNKVNEINFASSDDIHTMAHVYESMLREMRDAAGDSGEFYTPRPIIRFIVQQVDPKLGEIVLDPACGTGGFLVEALEHLAPSVRTTQQRRALQRNLRGIEKKPLPYLLGMMNLVLHGVGQPNITRGNALGESITQIGKAKRVDVILTNPPFGGEEEKSIQANFPADKQISETAWLFMQLVIRLLKDGGRCGIVVPNGLLFGGGVGARIKKQLLTDCNLHTVVRLPDGAFAPYTDIPTNLLFFDKTGRTKEVWYYQIPPPDGRKKYSKTKPMRFEEFADCQAWWSNRVENERAWRVPIADLEDSDYNLDLRNPNRPDDLAHRHPAELLNELLSAEREILALLEGLQNEIAREG